MVIRLCEVIERPHNYLRDSCGLAPLGPPFFLHSCEQSANTRPDQPHLLISRGKKVRKKKEKWKKVVKATDQKVSFKQAICKTHQIQLMRRILTSSWTERSRRLREAGKTKRAQSPHLLFKHAKMVQSLLCATLLVTLRKYSHFNVTK